MIRNVPLEVVAHAVNAVMGTNFTAEDAFQKNRKRELVYVRHIYYYLLKKYHGRKTLESMAAEFGQDHATVLHAKRKIQGFLDVQDPEVTAIVNLAEPQFEAAVSRKMDHEKLHMLTLEQQLQVVKQRERIKSKETIEVCKKALYNMGKIMWNDKYSPGWIRHKARKEYEKAIQLIES